MTPRTDRRGTFGRRALCVAFYLLGALAAVFCQPGTAVAQWATNGNNINNTNTGNVGIGTSSPGFPLHIARDGGVAEVISSADAMWGPALGFRRTRGTHASPALVSVGDNLGQLDFNGYNNAFRTAAQILGQVDTGVGATGADMPGRLLFLTTPDGAETPIERMRINSSGNVGIGTTSPGLRFHVASGASGAAPSPTLSQVVLESNGSGGLQILNPDNQIGRLMFGTPSASNGIAVSAMLRWDYTNKNFDIATDQTNGYLRFLTGGFVERMRIDSSGNVGIGIPSPTEKLHVVGNGKVTGNLTVDGNIAAKYQDVAEWVPSTQKLSAGTVVVLDAERSNHVVASTASYDTGVAGVVSETPGLLLGEAGDGKLMVATTGRVKVKVDATRAPVKIGDLLVTGDTPGVAMRSEPITVGGRKLHAPGTIVGKALEPLEKGVGEILVLLSLQ